jgi:hypothetical protein
MRRIGSIHTFVSTNMGLLLTGFMWTFLVGSANRLVYPLYYSGRIFGNPLNGILEVIRAPLHLLVVFIFAFCFCIYFVALFRSLKVVCSTDYESRMLTFYGSLFGSGLLAGLVFLIY